MPKHPKSSRKPNSFLNKPVYEGGIKAMRAFIKKHLKYPKAAIDGKIEGSVKIRYDIDYKGNVIKTKVIKSIGYGCDEEAERLVNMFKFKVDKTRKVRVIFHKNIQINFKLPEVNVKPVPKKPPVQRNLSLRYNMVSSPEDKKEEIEKPKKVASYTYTINVQ